MALTVIMNGTKHTLPDLQAPVDLPAVLAAFGFKADRIAVEQNGEIVRRSAWTTALVKEGDKLEVVHFVGGGCCNQAHVRPFGIVFG